MYMYVCLCVCVSVCVHVCVCVCESPQYSGKARNKATQLKAMCIVFLNKSVWVWFELM